MHDQHERHEPTPTARSRPSTAPCGRSATTPPSPTTSSATWARCWSRPAGVRAGERVLDVAAGSGNAAIPAAARRRHRRRLRPDAGAVRRGPAAGRRAAASRSSGARPTPRRCRSPTASSTPCCPASGSCSPRTTRPAADELVRVCRPGGTIGLLSWTPGGLHRPDVRHHEAVRAAAAARRAAAAAVGQRGARRGAARRPGHRRRRRRGQTVADRPVRRRRRSSATTSRPATARRSRSTGRSPTTPRRSPRWTASSTSSPPLRPRRRQHRHGLGVPAAHLRAHLPDAPSRSSTMAAYGYFARNLATQIPTPCHTWSTRPGRRLVGQRPGTSWAMSYP